MPPQEMQFWGCVWKIMAWSMLGSSTVRLGQGKSLTGTLAPSSGRIPTFALQKEEPALCRHGKQSLKSLHCQKSGSQLGHVLVICP